MQAMPQAQGSSAHSCLFHIQQSPPCFDSQHKKTTTLYNTLTIHSKHAICHKSLNSQNSPSLSLSVSPLASLRQLPVAHQPNTFVTKARFYCFFLHQTQSKHDGNVREKAWQTLFFVKSGFGRAGASVDSGGGPWGWASS